MGFLSWLGGVIVIIWLFLFFLKIGGWLIHILIVVAVISFIIDLLRGGKNKGK